MNTTTFYMLIAVFAVTLGITALPAFAQQESCPDCEGSGVETAQMSLLEKVPISVWSNGTSFDHESVINVDTK